MHTLQLWLILLAFVLIVLEDVVHINKAKSTLFLGSLVWILAFVFPEGGHGAAAIQEALNENLLEIATLWLFLMAAMTFVTYLNQAGVNYPDCLPPVARSHEPAAADADDGGTGAGVLIAGG